MDCVRLTTDPLNVEELMQMVTLPHTGATSMFIGTTRDHFEGKAVQRLEYEAYIPMAEIEIRKICTKMRTKWKLEHIAIYHRLGLVGLTEASVIIAISSEHRRESLEAVQYAIDHLKTSVPVWKKEVYADGESTWKENKECQWTNPNSKCQKQ